ncbi:MAG: hypothetical protein BAJATHORv1_10604 [Candidatus Thorarchaeota archaeon]|nr:MAG: hypothetical protein BAJATHORv1_10604 [Candidatus Thorarchaeota archaeon]
MALIRKYTEEAKQDAMASLDPCSSPDVSISWFNLIRLSSDR